jgi:hypothetical protein
MDAGSVAPLQTKNTEVMKYMPHNKDMAVKILIPTVLKWTNKT